MRLVSIKALKDKVKIIKKLFSDSESNCIVITTNIVEWKSKKLVKSACYPADYVRVAAARLGYYSNA